MHPVEMSRNKSTLIVLDVANKVPNEWLIPEFRYLVDCFLQVIFAKCRLSTGVNRFYGNGRLGLTHSDQRNAAIVPAIAALGFANTFKNRPVTGR